MRLHQLPKKKSYGIFPLCKNLRFSLALYLFYRQQQFSPADHLKNYFCFNKSCSLLFSFFFFTHTKSNFFISETLQSFFEYQKPHICENQSGWDSQWFSLYNYAEHLRGLRHVEDLKTNRHKHIGNHKYLYWTGGRCKSKKMVRYYESDWKSQLNTKITL